MANELRKLQLAELDLFKKFSNLCDQYGITYYALGGTLLGAIRDGGFIPWDDDMDVGIPRPDYDRFCKIMEKEGKENDFYFRSYKNDKNYIRYFSHLENLNINVIRHDNIKEEKTYAWIDIFPLDAMPNNWILREIKVFEVLALRAFYRFSCFDTLVNVNKKNRPIHERILIFIGLHFPVQKIFNTRKCLTRLEKALTSIKYKDSKYLVNAMGAYKFKEMFPKEYYGDGEMYHFEDTEIRGPIDYDKVCRQLYGDYMSPPPINERNHHGLVGIE